MTTDHLQCKYCGFQYKTITASMMILHECNDQEWHYINQQDLKERPLKELTKDPKPLRYKLY